jgi:hypothetical protein
VALAIFLHVHGTAAEGLLFQRGTPPYAPFFAQLARLETNYYSSLSISINIKFC